MTGDIEKAGELEILEYMDRMDTICGSSTEKECTGKKQDRIFEDIDVLKVAHHGSSGSGSEEFLERIQPELSLISCGRNNTYGHPHEETLERLRDVGSRIMSTVDSGAITLKIGKGVRVYEYRE